MRVRSVALVLFVVLSGMFSCKKSYQESHISLENYKIEEGFKLELIASEPLIKAPVAIDFDDSGRIWVVEMPAFMRNINGDGEDEPTGTIKILEDLDKDGIMDHSKIFLDSLVLPRAISLVYGGLLYAEPSNLWFVEINGDKPGKRTLVDSLYVPVGNPEHQANGLKLNIDNWIYSAKSNARYQLKKGKWVKEVAGLKGQWGITRDNYGRLYYNNNSTLLLADFLLPNRLIRNPYFEPKVGVNQAIAQGQRVYPLQASYVNRGYAKGVLDQDSLLIKVTAACAPLIYRGGAFDMKYDNNVFVCLPSANVIKRNILSTDSITTIANSSSTENEFLASYDRGFRPVNLNNGPDGNMYVVDMHIGMLQHYAFLSPYLKKISKEKKLDTIIDLGRILKISSESQKFEDAINFDRQSPEELVSLLKHKNGWIRDHAQHYMIYGNRKDAITYLKKQLLDTNDPITQLHSLYTLDGLDALDANFLIKVARTSDQQTIASALVLLENYVSDENTVKTHELFKDLMQLNNSVVDLYIGTTLGKWSQKSQDSFFPLMLDLLNRYPDNTIYHEAILSGIADVEKEVAIVLNTELEANTIFKDALDQVILRKNKNNISRIYKPSGNRADARTTGAKLYRSICAACHGANGSGIAGLAPPLMNSEYINRPHKKLGLIILHGLEGPVHVNNTLYELDNAMPGLLYNEKLTNQDIADIISYVTSAFSDSPGGLRRGTIEELRKELPISGSGYTEQELIEIGAQ